MRDDKERYARHPEAAARGITPFCVFAFCSVLWSCGEGGSRNESTTSTQQLMDSVIQVEVSDLERYVKYVYGADTDQKGLVSLRTVLDRNGFAAASQEFIARYDVDSLDPFKWGNGQIENYQQTILVESLQQVMIPYINHRNEVDPANDVFAGVMFHYGVSNGRFDCGITPLKMTWQDPATKKVLEYDTVGEPFYKITAGGTLVKTDRTTWRTAHWKTDYVGKVRVKFSAIDIRPVEDMDDAFAEGEAMLYQELQNINERSDRLSGVERRYVVTCINEPDPTKLADIIHRVTVHLQDDRVDVLDNVEHKHDYTNRAVELGTPCPPRCKFFDVKK